MAGLGNPGADYIGTRHNSGFALADRVAEELSVQFEEGPGPSRIAEGSFRGRKVLLVKPLTWMNRSGQAVRRIAGKFQISANSCLICYDDVNLPPGQIRLRPGGSAGGHNGLEDVLRMMDTREIPRLRIGIGNSFERGGQSRYVLSPFDAGEEKVIAETLDRATEAVLTFIHEGLDAAMNRFN
ncbi:MAG: aminoacyl-tRNA hydrolase [Balneolaceae bacterium]